MKKLYALLVGINDYLPPISPLNGCIPDIQRISEYLNKYEKDRFDLHIEMLSNAGANRANVITLFKSHLAKASKDDTVLFYYSGHGAQEKADTDIWRFEPDGNLEGLVLYDSIPSDYENTRLLADKELRYLFHHVAHFNEKKERKDGSPHIVVVMDCCHSGENTRGFKWGTNEERPLPRQVTPKSGQAFPMRSWEGFCFANEISINDLKNKPIDEVLPQAKQIGMAACRSFEKAWEEHGAGVFTKNLIRVLERSQGVVTYYDLRNRIKNYIKGQHPQVPQIYATNDPQAANQCFLGGEAVGRPLYANIVYNNSEGWLMDMGAMHGISRQVADRIVVTGSDGSVFEAEIKEIGTSDTKLVFRGDKKPSESSSYQGEIKHFLSAPTNIFINNADEEEGAEMALRSLIKESGNAPNLFVVKDEAQADYTVQILFDYYAITKPYDPNRPLVLPQKTDDAGAKTAFDYLRHISQFDYVKNLENTASNQLPPYSIRFEIFQVMPNGEEVPLSIQNDRGREILECNYSSGSLIPQPRGEIKIKLTNTTNRPLYTSLVYLSNDFQSFTGLIDGVQYLPAGASVWALDGRAIGLNYEKHVQISNLPSTDIDFKIIASEQPIDIQHFELKALPTFSELVDPDRSSTSKGGLDLGDTTTRSGDAWTTRLVTLKIKNPKHNLVSHQLLNQWLGSAGGPFVESIYLTSSLPFGGGETRLKSGMRWMEEEGARGFIFNLKLKLANAHFKKRRFKKFKKMRAERPDLPVIVSEGDSWFQYPHPALKEIIDHLMNHFAIRSLDAGGDTLEGLFQSGELFQAIEEERPEFLLLSGGGNDILGEEVKELIAEHISENDALEGENAARFLNEKFNSKIERLCNIYKTIFDRIQNDYPNLQIICHGYDYILPNPKKGWFCQHIKKKIKRPGDQKALADHLINTFNDCTKELAANYPNVHFLDNRNTVRPHLWEDEIHPNSTGFMDVALKFYNKINELRAARA